jgi:hypothetical protein
VVVEDLLQRGEQGLALAGESFTNGEAIAKSDRRSRAVVAARDWFARRRTNKSAQETVIAVYDRSASAVDQLGIALRDYGFDEQLTRIGVNTADGVRQIPVACHRNVVDDEEVSIYLLNTNPETSATSDPRAALAARAAKFLTPIYAAADVLVFFLEVSEKSTESSDIADLDALESLLGFDSAQGRKVFLVRPAADSLRLAVESRLESLGERATNQVTIVPVDHYAEPEVARAVGTIFEQLARERTSDVVPTPASAADSALTSEPVSSVDNEIERAAYETILLHGARRLLLIDDTQTLLGTEDAADPDRDWSSVDEQLLLQLSVLPTAQLESVLLRNESGFCAIDALNERHEIFVVTMWDSTFARDEILQKSQLITKSMSDTFDRLRAQGH